MTYKSKFAIIAMICVLLIAGSVFMIAKDVRNDTQDVALAPVEFINGTDDFGHDYTVEFYPEEGFCILSIYMEEDKEHSWKWVDVTNKITCNYIHYQDDHYVVSYKPDTEYIGACQSAIMLAPIEDTHNHTKDITTEYAAYVINVEVAEDGNHVFDVYHATVTDEYTTGLDDESEETDSADEHEHEHTHESTEEK